MAIQPKQQEGSKLYAAQTRRTNALAIQEELKLQRIQGTLVLRAAVEQEVFNMVRRSRDSLQNIPSRWSGILAAEPDQSKIFAILTQAIQEALEGLAAEHVVNG